MPRDESYLNTVASLEAIGATTAAKFVRESLSQFRRGIPPLDPQEPGREYQSIPLKVRRRLDYAFFDQLADIDRRLAEFIEQSGLTARYLA